MSIETLPVSSGTNIHTTAARRELLGWCGAMTWLFLMMYLHDMFLLDNIGYFDGSWYPVLFMLTFALSIAVFSYRFGRDPNGLAKIAFYTTPAAIVITAALGFLTQPLCTIMYVLSPVFMAPAITRRVYGVIRTAEPGRLLLRYASGFSISFVAFAALVIFNLPKEITFLVAALLSIPAWIGVRRSLTIPDELPENGVFRFSKRYMLMLAAVVTVMVWLVILGRVMLTIFFAGGDETTSVALDTFLTWIPPALCLLLYAVTSDRGHERTVFICGMSLSLIGIMLALLSSDAQGAALLPLIFAFCFGEMYIEFFLYTTPVHFFMDTKRPVFAASIGCIFYLIVSALEWKKDVWLPKMFMELGIPLLVSAAITTVIFIVMVYFLFERHHEKTLAAALYAMLHGKAGAEAHTPGETETTEEQKMADIGFTEDEIKVAMLLIEGDTRHDITRKLHLTSEDTNLRMSAIRKKISGAEDSDPVITAVVKKYSLTRRQTDMLRYIREGMTNAEIAKALSISDETVKVHMRNLKQKLSVGNKQEIAEWLDAFCKEQG